MAQTGPGNRSFSPPYLISHSALEPNDRLLVAGIFSPPGSGFDSKPNDNAR
jgi:hypothetical protein